MKKKLEADLISIAHRILKIRNTSDVVTLHREAQKLYETLSVLRFVEDHLGEVQPTIGISQITQKIEAVYDSSNKNENDAIADETETVAQPDDNFAQEKQLETKAEAEDLDTSAPENTNENVAESADDNLAETQIDELAENASNDSDIALEDKISEQGTPTEEIVEAVDESKISSAVDEKAEKSADEDETKSLFIPSFELAFDPKTDAEILNEEAVTPQFTFDDLLGKDYSDPVFVKADEKIKSELDEKSAAPLEYTATTKETATTTTTKSYSINDKLSKGITIGLNDRIAFMKHLFGNSSEDYNRVLSQLLTFDTYEEAENFISDMVKPDYNNWEGKDEYSQRFMEIIERRFS